MRGETSRECRLQDESFTGRANFCDLVSGVMSEILVGQWAAAQLGKIMHGCSQIVEIMRESSLGLLFNRSAL